MALVTRWIHGLIPFGLVVSCYTARNQATTLEVRLTNGIVRGNLLRNNGGLDAAEFYGIPYAEPPVEKLRFARPVPKNPWNDTSDCTEQKPNCFLGSQKFGQEHFSEDCLYINLIGPTPVENTSYPVLVLIQSPENHYELSMLRESGAIVSDIAGNGILFVTADYRRGPLSFWSTGTDELPGNNGLSDLRMALQWIKAEIENFGGNPNSVTLISHGNGAAVVDLLLLSLATNGLFHHIIMLSPKGIPATLAHESDLSNFQQVAANLNCAHSNDWIAETFGGIIDCMRHLPVEHLLTSLPALGARMDGENGLFPATSYEKLTAARKPMPVLLGTVVENDNSKFEQVHITDLICAACAWAYGDYGDDNRTVQQRIQELRADVTYHVPCLGYTQLLTNLGFEVFLYSIQSRNFLENNVKSEVSVIFKNLQDGEKSLRNTFMNIVLNFVKFGKPNNTSTSQNWLPFNADFINYFEVDKLASRNYYHQTAAKFWQELVPQLLAEATNNNYEAHSCLHPVPHKRFLDRKDDFTYSQIIVFCIGAALVVLALLSAVLFANLTVERRYRTPEAEATLISKNARRYNDNEK